MPVLPLTLYVILCVHAYGFIAGTIISWLGVVAVLIQCSFSVENLLMLTL